MSQIWSFLRSNSTVSGRIQDGAKPFASVKGGGLKQPCILYVKWIIGDMEDFTAMWLNKGFS